MRTTKTLHWHFKRTSLQAFQTKKIAIGQSHDLFILASIHWSSLFWNILLKNKKGKNVVSQTEQAKVLKLFPTQQLSCKNICIIKIPDDTSAFCQPFKSILIKTLHKQCKQLILIRLALNGFFFRNMVLKRPALYTCVQQFARKHLKNNANKGRYWWRRCNKHQQGIK